MLTTTLFSLISYYFYNITNINILISNKINKIKGLITFWTPGWYENMPTSPRYRVAEFANICVEYVKKLTTSFLAKDM